MIDWDKKIELTNLTFKKIRLNGPCDGKHVPCVFRFINGEKKIQCSSGKCTKKESCIFPFDSTGLIKVAMLVIKVKNRRI